MTTMYKNIYIVEMEIKSIFKSELWLTMLGPDPLNYSLNSPSVERRSRSDRHDRGDWDRGRE